MKIVSLISRYLLGFVFLVFGLNGFLHFLPMGPMPAGAAAQFLGALVSTHYVVPIFALQLIGAVLLLIGLYVPLGLTLLGPIIVNILLFHVLMVPAGLPIALIVAMLWIVVALSVRSAFSGILQARVTQ